MCVGFTIQASAIAAWHVRLFRIRRAEHPLPLALGCPASHSQNKREGRHDLAAPRSPRGVAGSG